MTSIPKKTYSLLRHFRLNHIYGILNGETGTLLDIGCSDAHTMNALGGRFKVTLADINPQIEGILAEDVQQMSFPGKSFDFVICSEVLEHVADPVKAMRELARVCKKKLIISTPREPFFTLFRFLKWDDEHLWAITPKAMRNHLGRPSSEETFLMRYYIGVWDMQ